MLRFYRASSKKTRLRLILAILFVSAFIYTLFVRRSASPEPVSFTPTNADVAIVTAVTREENAGWLKELFPHFSHYIYSVDDPTAPLTTRNKGHEGSAYLTYLIDNYDSLHKYTVFIHPSRYQWHNDDRMYDGAAILQRLDFSSVERQGYVNMRCTWSPGCDNKIIIRPTLQWDGRFGWMTLLGRAHAELFPHKPMPEIIRTPSSAQFVISKECALRNTRQDYERYRDFLWDWSYSKYLPEVQEEVISPVNVSDPEAQSGLAGEMMENLWHIVFGQVADHCLPVGQCYCETYGVCDAVCPDESHCKDRYFKPPSKKMPEGWPEHGQGSRGWPSDGWWLTIP